MLLSRYMHKVIIGMYERTDKVCQEMTSLITRICVCVCLYLSVCLCLSIPLCVPLALLWQIIVYLQHWSEL